MGRAAGTDERGRPVPLGRRVEGVIVENPSSTDDVAALVERGLRVVQALRPQLSVPTSTVTMAASAGTAAAVEHLAGRGHTRIAFVGRGGEHPLDLNRHAAFRAAMDAAGCPSRGLRPPDDQLWPAQRRCGRCSRSGRRRRRCSPPRP